MRRLLALALLCTLLATSVPAEAQSGGDEILVVRVEGVVTRGTSMHVQNAIEEAEERRAPLVISLDTPGGLVSATLDIKRAVERAEVPVLTWVGPRGAFAESAGTFMFLMGQPNGMAPNTQIGSAQPIVQDATGGTKNASSKTTNFLITQLEQIANSTGRNGTLAKQFITQNRNMDPEEAQRTGMVDVLAEDLEAFVRAVHGEQARVGPSTITLDTQDARIVEVEKGTLTNLIEIVGNPQVAFILFLVGLYGVIFGLAAPGTFVPETIGAIALLLGLIGLGLFDTSTAGFLLILLAAAFFVAEVFTPTHGILTTAGAVTLLLAAIFLLDEPLLSRDFLRTFTYVGAASAVVSGGVVLAAVWVALRVRSQPIEHDLVGKEAEALTRLDPRGYVMIRGERWRAAVQGGAVDEGERVVVTERDGLELTVEPREQPGGADDEPESDA